MEKYTIFQKTRSYIPYHITLLQVFLECSNSTEIVFETRYGTRSLISNVLVVCYLYKCK